MRLATACVLFLVPVALAQKPEEAAARGGTSSLASAFKAMADAKTKHSAELAELQKKVMALPAAERRDSVEAKRASELNREIGEASKPFNSGWQTMLEEGKFEDGLKAMTEAAQITSDDTKAQALIRVGHLSAALGKATAAATAYAEANKLATDAGTKRDLPLFQMVGKAAPELDSKTWLGADAAPLSKLAGKVVMVDFWATWCPPCRAVMPKLDAMYQAHKADGLVVVGATHVYPNGYMVENKGQMPNGGKPVAKIAAEEFNEHVATFKKNSEISYPFVIGTNDDFKNFNVGPIPTLVVIDKSGKVALAVVGSGPANEALLQATVKNLLKAKS